MSKEPRPLPQPGDPQYRDPSKPRVSSPPPPPKRTMLVHKCCHEHRIEELERALRVIQTWATGYEWPNATLANIRNKCREALTTGEGE